MSRPFSARRLFPLPVLVLAALALASLPAQADLFVFKDGFVIEGKANRLMESKWMGNKEGFLLTPKGFYFIDDGPRLVIFKHTDLKDIVQTGEPNRVKLRGGPYMQVNAKPMLSVLEVTEVTPWDSSWHRKITVRSEGINGAVTLTLPQQIAGMDSYFVGVASTGRYSWSSFYLTRELGQDEVQGLLSTAAALKDDPKLDAGQRVARRYKRVDFLTQAGWYRLAEQDLDRLVADFPDEKSKVEETRKAIVERRANERLEKIRRMHTAGQHETVARLIAAFPRTGAPLQVLTALEDLEAQAKATTKRIEETRRLLRLACKEADGPLSDPLSRAAKIILSDLQPENIDRLETFLSQARQYERQQKAGRKPTASADQLLALAVSSRLLGNAAADPKPENAVGLWQGRQLVLDYLHARDPQDRKRLLEAFQARHREKPGIDEIMRMIPTLPPADADEKVSADIQELTIAGAQGGNGSSEEPGIANGKGRYRYLVQLPPEYRPTRSYPVLMVLHNGGEKPRDALERWREAAAENGYIVAAPQWGDGFSNAYSYTEAEHEVVLQTLRDLRRRYQVDSDRVFLFGQGEGGKMAFDVGLSHPSEFAGILPMAAGPEMFSMTYWPNAQVLPLYVVHGTQDEGGGCTNLKEMFTLWTQKGQTAFPSIWVDYKGRGCEWFGGEVPNIFEWMRPKRRAFPLTQLGQHVGRSDLDTDFRSLRPGDNRFYWLSYSKLSPACMKTAANYRGRINPALLSAHINGTDNIIRVHAEGVGQVTVWLGRDSKGANMINFDNPVTVFLNMRPVVTKQKITPSLATLLEDLYERGDRQQMFLARIVLGR